MNTIQEEAVLKIGLVGLDTSHATAFAQLLNDPASEHHIPGARVAFGYPGGSPDFRLSIDRVDGFTAELRDKRGVEILESPEAVAEASDLVFITAVDGRVHPDLFQRVIKSKKPVFIDKPFALTAREAREMVSLAESADVPLMSCSSLRYAEELVAALAGGREGIVACDVSGPMAQVPSQPGLFWYGCHTVEMMVAIMGAGCREVRCVKTENHDLLTATWANGRVASIHGLRDGHNRFSALIHRKEGTTFADACFGRPYYAGLLEAILGSLPNGVSAVPSAEMIEVVAILEAGNQSRNENGAPVAVCSAVAPKVLMNNDDH